jgi:alkanesulfonate monooxygenase SsuD/methylene tetrahydromethanopterin reductase-like flavin-dependent oxidoreductase (luciferase family)
MSAGRVVLGLGIGDFAAEFEQMGLAFPPTSERQQALQEVIHILRGLWGGEHFTFTGEHFRVHQAHVFPAPVQEPRVPVLIAGTGERVTLHQVAEFADASNFGPNPHTGNVLSVEAVRTKFEVLHKHCAQLGRPYASVLRTHWSPPAILAETRSALREKVDSISSPEQRFYDGAHVYRNTGGGHSSLPAGGRCGIAVFHCPHAGRPGHRTAPGGTGTTCSDPDGLA